jgi:hypothetical protein
MTDLIVKADNGLTNVENQAASKTGEFADLISNAVTHFNALLAALASDAKVGVSAVENGIGGTANLVVSTEDLLKAVAPSAQTVESLATPPAA